MVTELYLGYTGAEMKTAISLPEPLFAQAELLAKRLGFSRSQLYAHALELFVAARRSEEIRASYDRAYASDSEDPEVSAFVRAAARAARQRSEW